MLKSALILVLSITILSCSTSPPPAEAPKPERSTALPLIVTPAPAPAPAPAQVQTQAQAQALEPEPLAQQVMVVPPDDTAPPGRAQMPAAAPTPMTSAAAPATKSVPPEDPFATVDRLLEELEFGNIAFNTPKVINLNDTAIIQLMLGLATPTEELMARIEGAGAKEGYRIRVSDRMEARLTGPNFAITTVTPEVQAVTRTEVTEWKWDIKPINMRPSHLHLTLSVFIDIDGASTLRTIKTFDRDIAVEVTLRQRFATFVKQNWQWLWAVILVPVVGGLWRKRKASN